MILRKKLDFYLPFHFFRRVRAGIVRGKAELMHEMRAKDKCSVAGFGLCRMRR